MNVTVNSPATRNIVLSRKNRKRIVAILKFIYAIVLLAREVLT
ncbi:hypothetical protein J2W97_002400 [Paenibacillus jamilae]|nr:hypothetical protein [Paenibacillus jamilae]MDP9676405.1 hypothetical protein [Paenibacillus jamilae]